MKGAQRARLPDGRLHLQHGPIDLVIEAWGAPAELEAGYAQAWRRFETILDALVAELPLLRAPVGAAYPLSRDAVARRMIAAVWPHRQVFVTPMAAVAGAVADEVLAAMLVGCALPRACVNNGGDIAIHVAHGESLAAGMVANPEHPSLDASVRLLRSCGLATSGWRGRSQSLGIADAVTVIARSAADADAAATLIANAVDVHHPGIERRPARELREDSDLGDLPVTVGVPVLPPEAAEAALDSGMQVATALQRRDLITAGWLSLQGRQRVLHGPATLIGDAAWPQTDAKS